MVQMHTTALPLEGDAAGRIAQYVFGRNPEVLHIAGDPAKARNLLAAVDNATGGATHYESDYLGPSQPQTPKNPPRNSGPAL